MDVQHANRENDQGRAAGLESGNYRKADPLETRGPNTQYLSSQRRFALEPWRGPTDHRWKMMERTPETLELLVVSDVGVLKSDF
jgi:hypothetical protein